MPLLSPSLFQLLMAFVSAVILHRLTSENFFLRWLERKSIIYYQTPTDEELKDLRDSATGSNRKARRANERRRQQEDASENRVFKLPANILGQLRLNGVRITLREILAAPFADDLEWICDLAIMSIVCYAITQLQVCIYPQSREWNFSLIWFFLVIAYCVKMLFYLTYVYFKTSNASGERSICLVSYLMFLTISMAILVYIPEKTLEFGLDKAYESFNSTAHVFLESHSKPDATGAPASFFIVKTLLAICSAFIGMLFTFPGIRFGQLSKHLMDDERTGSLIKILLRLNYTLPLFIVLLWVKPITRDTITKPENYNISHDVFEALRISIVIFVDILRILLVPFYLMAFLDTVFMKVFRLRCQGGVVTNVQIQRSVASIRNYFNIVTVQYMVPGMLALFTAILLLLTANFNWVLTLLDKFKIPDLVSPVRSEDTLNVSQGPHAFITNYTVETSGPSTLYADKLFSTITMIKLAEIKKLYSPEVCRGLLSYAVWWIHFSWFTTTTIGYAYHIYFT